MFLCFIVVIYAKIIFFISSLTTEYPEYVIRYYRNNNKSMTWDVPIISCILYHYFSLLARLLMA